MPFHVHTCLPTYGQPRVGNEAFRTFYNAGAPQRTWRLTHWRDPAPPAWSGHRQAAALVARLLAALASWGCLGLPRAASGCLGLPPLRAPGCVTHPGRTRDEPPSRAAPKPRPKVANWPKVADSERATRRCPTCRCVPWASRTSAPRSGGTSAGAAAGCVTAAERMRRAPIRSVACAMHVCTASHTACACVCACVLHVHVHGLARSPSPQRQTPPTLTPTITLVHVSPWADWLHRLRLFHLRPPPLLQGGHRRWGVLPRAERDAARAAKQNGRGQAGG